MLQGASDTNRELPEREDKEPTVSVPSYRKRRGSGLQNAGGKVVESRESTPRIKIIGAARGMGDNGLVAGGWIFGRTRENPCIVSDQLY